MLNYQIMPSTNTIRHLFILCSFFFFSYGYTENLEPPKKPLEFDKSNWKVDHDFFIIHGIHKCGTHFIRRIISLMCHQQGIVKQVHPSFLQRACKKNQILMITEPYHPTLAKVLQDANHKTIALIRDPRDALISHVFYMRRFASTAGGPLKRDFFSVGPIFDSLSLDEQITALIVGNEHAPSYLQFYAERTGWALNPLYLQVKYEDLVGSAGGGSDEKQRAVVKDIADYILLSISEEQLDEIVSEMYLNFGETLINGKVYKHSSIGNWRVFLSAEQKELIQDLFGTLLIGLGYEEGNHEQK
jgi:hypothetical protein